MIMIFGSERRYRVFQTQESKETGGILFCSGHGLYNAGSKAYQCAAICRYRLGRSLCKTFLGPGSRRCGCELTIQTGLAYNGTLFGPDTSAAIMFSFAWASHVKERPGYVNDDYTAKHSKTGLIGSAKTGVKTDGLKGVKDRMCRRLLLTLKRKPVF